MNKDELIEQIENLERRARNAGMEAVFDAAWPLIEFARDNGGESALEQWDKNRPYVGTL